MTLFQPVPSDSSTLAAMATRPVARPWRLALLALLAGPAWIGPRGSAVPARAAPVARASGRSSEWPEMFAWATLVHALGDVI